MISLTGNLSNTAGSKSIDLHCKHSTSNNLLHVLCYYLDSYCSSIQKSCTEITLLGLLNEYHFCCCVGGAVEKEWVESVGVESIVVVTADKGGSLVAYINHKDRKYILYENVL